LGVSEPISGNESNAATVACNPLHDAAVWRRGGRCGTRTRAHQARKLIRNVRLVCLVIGGQRGAVVLALMLVDVGIIIRTRLRIVGSSPRAGTKVLSLKFQRIQTALP
jgi:hypothetical protein